MKEQKDLKLPREIFSYQGRTEIGKRNLELPWRIVDNPNNTKEENELTKGSFREFQFKTTFITIFIRFESNI